MLPPFPLKTSHQIQVEPNKLQPRHQGQEESQVIVAADQGIPARQKKKQPGDFRDWSPAWLTLTRKPTVLKLDI